jgi:hypothetical protein
MDIEEFVKQVQPRKKRSRLIPFRDQIMTLKTQGYTDLQIRDWLGQNGLAVSREMVRKFVAQQAAEKQPQDTTESPVTKSPDQSNLASSITFDEPASKPAISQADKMRQKLEAQKRDADSKLFKHDKTGNTK